MNKSYLYAGITVFFWATIATAFKIALRYVNYVELVLYCSVTTVIILFFILLFQNRLKEVFRIRRVHYINSLVLGFINPFFYYLILFKAYSLLPAQIAQPLNFTWPIVLTFLSLPVLKQPVTGKNILALFISFIGVYFISSEGSPFNMTFAEPLGVFLAVGSSLVWSAYWLVNIKDQREEVIKIFLNFLFSLLFIIPYWLIFSEPRIPSLNGILASVYSGAFEMGITFVLWLKALKYAKSTAVVSNLIYLAPFFSLIFIQTILREQIYYTTIIGLVLIVAGIVYQELHKTKSYET
ncbi:MAG: DMT family transporter [Bacteroidales bacterium]|nr:DMT family transporter [Bacteroidales bacterium]MBS3774675.1 DMT family transporter [Bacteroidales bacterium]